MADDDIRASLGFVKVLAVRTAAAAIDAKALYDSNCVRCHGADGDKISGVKHSSKEFWYSQGEETITKAIRNGKGGMPPFARNQGGTLSDIEIEAVVEYLRSFPGPMQAQATPQSGKDLFAKNCAACHGDKGDRVASANMAAKDYVTGKGNDGLAKSINDGKGGMPAFGKTRGGALSEDQIKAIVDYINDLAGVK